MREHADFGMFGSRHNTELEALRRTRMGER
jgi:hypothetical protein